MNSDYVIVGSLCLMLAAVGIAGLVQIRRENKARLHRDYLDTPPPSDGQLYESPAALGELLDALHPTCRQHTLSLVDEIGPGVTVEECTTCCNTFVVDGTVLRPLDGEPGR